MADQKRVWFSFLPLDYLGVEQYLNDYAAQGWELSETSDCRALTVRLQKTNRTDLQYSVSCASFVKQGDLRETVERRQAMGWNPVATINHFDIYASRPCCCAVPEQEDLWRPLFLRSICAFFSVLFFSAFLFLLAYTHKEHLLHSWYLSNMGLYLHFFAPVFGAVAVCYLLWLGWSFRCRKRNCPPKRGWLVLRGILPVLAAVWMLVLTIALVTDLIDNRSYVLLLIAIFVGVSVVCYFRLRVDQTGKLFSALSLILAVTIALAVVLNQVLPTGDRSQLGASPWRTSLSGVVHAEDVGFQPSSLEAVSYATQGSFFVKETKYWEGWKTLSLSSIEYRCKGGLLVQKILADLMWGNDWRPVSSKYEGCWSAEKGKTYFLLCYDRNTIVLLSANQALLPHLAELALSMQ